MAIIKNKKKFWITFIISLVLGIFGALMTVPIYQVSPLELFGMQLIRGVISFAIFFVITSFIWSMSEKKK